MATVLKQAGKTLTTFTGAVGFVAGLAACSVMPSKDLPREDNIDIQRFMGDWYVIAHIPPSASDDSYNSIENYRFEAPDIVRTTFTYNEGSFDGEEKKMEPTGFIEPDTGNAVWGMQFIWPFKLEYVVSYVDTDYDTTIIARSARDYVWLMSRQPTMSEDEYATMRQRIAALGYDLSKLRKVPQQSLAERSAQ